MLFHERVKRTPTTFHTSIKHTGDEVLVFYDGCTPDGVISLRPGQEVQINISAEIITAMYIMKQQVWINNFPLCRDNWLEGEIERQVSRAVELDPVSRSK